MKNAEVDKKKISVIVFLILTIVAGIAAFVTLLFGIGIMGLSIYGIKSCNKMFNAPPSQTTAVSQPAGETVAFQNERLELGERGDGCYYTLIRMTDDDFQINQPGEYVVLKKSGSVPQVEYFRFFAETGQLHPYVVSYNLGTDDFSDMVDGKMIVQNLEFFKENSNLVFTVVDMDSDILKTPDEFAKERSDGINDAIASLIGFLFVGFISIVGVIVAVIQGLLALISFIAFIVFLILFIVFLVKSKKKTVPAKLEA